MVYEQYGLSKEEINDVEGRPYNYSIHQSLMYKTSKRLQTNPLSMTQKLKTTFLKLPEYYFIVLAILAGYTPPFGFNPIFMAIVIGLLVQIFFRNRIAGLALGGLFFLVNLLFLGALISEYREFAEFTDDAQKLIFVGMAVWIANLIFITAMTLNYAKQDYRRNPLVA